MHSESSTKMDVNARRRVQPGPPVPQGAPSNNWKLLILGTLLAITVPFWKNKLAPLLAWKREVDEVVEMIDSVTETVEQVAEEVEKIADEVLDKLPGGGKLQEAVCFVEKLAKEVAMDADQTDEFIHKVEGVEEKVEKEVEKFIEPVIDQENVETKESNEKNK